MKPCCLPSTIKNDLRFRCLVFSIYIFSIVVSVFFRSLFFLLIAADESACFSRDSVFLDVTHRSGRESIGIIASKPFISSIESCD